MFETFLWWLLAAFVFALVAGVVGYLVTRWLFVRTAERMAIEVDRRVGLAAARTFTRLANYAAATGIPLDEANRFFGAHIDRVARLMDSAITIPIIGKVGLDAVIGLVPVVGDLAGTAVSLTLVARMLRYGPPSALVSKMLANVMVDLVLGSIPLVGFFADVWFKANDRNAALMREYLSDRA
ncbi:MAG: DUF4112 domain-containing protein [Acidobacteriota bacterium]|nr:DUF4112 domain-containing protein [Acidobacteriota bacterium]